MIEIDEFVGVTVQVRGAEQGSTWDGVNLDLDGGDGVCFDADEAERLGRALIDAAALLRSRAPATPLELSETEREGHR